jgi:HAE1 family hydrophobic/amphiphilic exporter-1
VFAGMLAASTIGIFLIPLLYTVLQSMRERAGHRPTKISSTPGPAAVE